jgi:hypothetical protein
MRSGRVASLPPPLNWVNRGARGPRTIIDSLDQVNAWLKERPGSHLLDTNKTAANMWA